MELRDELLTVAELALTIVGFAAVVASFIRQGHLHAHDVVRFRILVLCAGVATALAFVPSLLFSLGFSPIPLWRMASGIMVIAMLASWVVSFHLIKSAPDGSQSRYRASTFVTGLSIVNLGLQGANATGMLWAPSGAVYLAGTFGWLINSVILFVGIIELRPSS